MRCLEDILRSELIEEDTIEIMSMDNRDIDMFLTNEEYEQDLATSVIHNDYLDSIAEFEAEARDNHEKLMIQYNFIHNRDDDELRFKDDDIEHDINSIMKHYDGCEELDSLNLSDINKEYDIINGEEKYDG